MPASPRANMHPQAQLPNALSMSPSAGDPQQAASSDALLQRTSYPHPIASTHSGGYHTAPAPVLSPNTYTLNLVGTLGLALVIGVVIYDFIAYIFAVYRNQTDSYSPYGRRMASLASELWERKTIFSGLNPYLKGRSLEPLTEIIDVIADAVKKWEEEPAEKLKSNSSTVAAAQAKPRTKKTQNKQDFVFKE